MEYLPGGLRGVLRGPTSVPYDEVDLVLRRDRRLDGLVGGASYDLLRSGASTVALKPLSDPAEVERALNGYVPAPRKRVDGDDETSVLTALQQRRVAWRGWPNGEPVPDSAVVTDEAVVASFGAATPDPAAVSRSTDSRPSTVTAADFESGNFPGGNGGGDADFTGGSTRHSPGHASNEGGAEANAEGGYGTAGEG